MKSRVGVVVLALVASSMSVAPVAAATTGLLGYEVTVAAYCCTGSSESNRITEPKTAVVGAGIEFPAGVVGSNVIASNIDVSDFAIDIQYVQNSPASGGSFNGYVFDFALGGVQRIVGVSLDPLSTPSGVGLAFDRDSVFYNAAGLNFTTSSRVLINVVMAPVPEPSLAAMFAAGLAVLGIGRRATRRRG